MAAQEQQAVIFVEPVVKRQQLKHCILVIDDTKQSMSTRYNSDTSLDDGPQQPETPTENLKCKE